MKEYDLLSLSGCLPRVRLCLSRVSEELLVNILVKLLPLVIFQMNGSASRVKELNDSEVSEIVAS